MKNSLCILLILFCGASVFGQPYDYPWKTTKTEIEKKHRLEVFELKSFQDNLNKYLDKSEASKFALYVVDNKEFRKFCDMDLSTIMGFYADSLVFYFLATQEMSFSREGMTNKCLENAIFGEDTLSKWKPIFKSSSKDGDIFREGACCGLGENDDEYLAMLISLGRKGVMNPEHMKFTNFLFSRDFLDGILQEKMKIHGDQKLILHPTSLFIESMTDDFKSLQKPPKKK